MTNDFTKEELKEIQDCLPFSCNPQMGFANKLFDKIQAMIDRLNCVHESDGYIYTNVDHTGGKQHRCIKCLDRFD